MVLSNYKYMHIRIQDPEILIQGLQTYSSNYMYIPSVSSNRIKIQVILLILQLETHYFSKLFISENAPFEAVALQSSQGLPELLIYMKKSYRILQLQFQLQFYMCTLHYTTLRSRKFSIQNPILHAEDKELFEYYYYIQRAKRPSLQIPEKKFYA